MRYTSSQSGYIAITTAIITSFVILLVAAVLGSSNLLSRLNDLDFSSKRYSYFLARSCVDTALLKLAKDLSYAGNETITISTDSCTIQPVITSGANKIIKASAQFNSTYTNLKVTVTSLDLTTVSLEEVTNF